jgi:hypothetical protein
VRDSNSVKEAGIFISSSQPKNSAFQAPSLLVFPKKFVPDFL